MKFTLGPYHVLLLIWCHIAWQAKTITQSSVRCNQLLLYTTYNTENTVYESIPKCNLLSGDCLSNVHNRHVGFFPESQFLEKVSGIWFSGIRKSLWNFFRNSKMFFQNFKFSEIWVFGIFFPEFEFVEFPQRHVRRVFPESAPVHARPDILRCDAHASRKFTMRCTCSMQVHFRNFKFPKTFRESYSPKLPYYGHFTPHLENSTLKIFHILARLYPITSRCKGKSEGWGKERSVFQHSTIYMHQCL